MKKIYNTFVYIIIYMIMKYSFVQFTAMQPTIFDRKVCRV